MTINMSFSFISLLPSAALSISEALERSVKYSHEKHSIMHDLHRVESELQSAKSEIVKDKEEILSLREKMKSFHSSKILADKKVAESLAANSRLEVPTYLSTYLPTYIHTYRH
jgi:hypothetical protein